VGDLPAGVIQQWRDWCLNRDYVVGHEGEPVRLQYAEVKTPILSLSFTDDQYMSLANVESLHGFYSGAPREMKRISPSDVGARSIGHFGFFRKRFADALWPQVGAWLKARAS
jgi:predicted alpha/beta hydrolase